MKNFKYELSIKEVSESIVNQSITLKNIRKDSEMFNIIKHFSPSAINRILEKENLMITETYNKNLPYKSIESYKINII